MMYALAQYNREGKLVNTRRYEIFNDGISDLRYCRTLRAADDTPATRDFLRRLAADVIEHPSDPARAEAARHAIAKRMLELQGAR